MLNTAQGFIVLRWWVRTLDELFEAITFNTNSKIGKFPIVLLGKTYWNGLIEWIKEKNVKKEKYSYDDLDLFTSRY